MPNIISQFGSLYRMRSGLWAPYYAALEQQLGSTATLVPFGDQEEAGKVNATTFKGLRFNASGLAPTWTPSEALSAWDTAFDLTDADNWLGLAPRLTFNGVDERITTPDVDYFTRLDTGSAPCSWGFWINVEDLSASKGIFSKWDAAVAIQEWSMTITSGEAMQPSFRDDSANVNINRTQDAGIGLGQWHHIVITYDGAGGATAMNTVVIYLDGASAASTANNNASYVAMENGTSTVSIGDVQGVASAEFAGKMLGGPWGPWFVQAELTAAQVANIYRVQRHGLGI